MRRLIPGIWGRLRLKQAPRHQHSFSALRVRPCLEVLEDRTTPSLMFTGALSGSVLVGGGTTGLAGVDVALTGTTTNGGAVNVSTITNANGAYDFTQLLPGTYGVASVAPTGFVAGSTTSITGIALANGQTISGLNLTVSGLAFSEVSLADFLNIPRFASILPAPGSGSASGFTLDSSNPLTNQTVVKGATTYLDLSGNFIDPNTANGTVVSLNTSLGAINIKLYDRDAPQTVTNFLNNIQAGDYSSDIFHRLVNNFVLQGGGFTVNADNSGNVTGFTTLTTFQPIQNESNDALHPNVTGTIAMARTSSFNSATSEFFFNLTNNSTTLKETSGNGTGYTVFGTVADSQSLNVVQQFASQYTPKNESAPPNSNPAFTELPLKNGFTPASNFPTGATTSDLAVINSATVVQPPTGQLSYTILSNSNPAVVTATLGSNTAGSTFSANQLQLVGKTAGSAVITIQVTDSQGDTVTKQFTVTVQ